MIVKMKKVTLLISREEKEEGLKQLQRLGIVHIKYLRQPECDEISDLNKENADLNAVLNILNPDKKDLDNKDFVDSRKLIDEVLLFSKKKSDLLTDLEDSRNVAKWYDRWGPISFESVRKIEKVGMYLRFYHTDKKSFKSLENDKEVLVVKDDKSGIFFIHFTQEEDDRLDFKEDPIPQIELDQLNTQIADFKNKIEEMEKILEDLSKFRDSLINYQSKLNKKLEFKRVSHSVAEEERFVYLQGYCPECSTDKIIKSADKHKWGYIIQDPDDPSEVPTLLKNSKWIRIVEPLFKFMGTLPGYDEIDVSMVFLVFFSIFYAMLIGDAGYGFVFLAVAVFFRMKSRDLPKEPFYLMYLLSGVTILWGLISGTWFGSEQLADIPVLSKFIIPQLDSFSDLSRDFIMKLCFIVGGLQLSVGHLMLAFKKKNSVKALAEFGWILILWGLFFVANTLVLGYNFPNYALPMIMAGIAIVALFANFQKNIIKGVFISLGNMPLDIIGSFSDIVSYIRLFAVGFAAVIVAASFNNMAAELGFNSIFSGIISALILIFGHVLNILLGVMAVLVHGIRLNMLEFSGHVDVKWTGKEYKPFRK